MPYVERQGFTSFQATDADVSDYTFTKKCDFYTDLLLAY